MIKYEKGWEMVKKPINMDAARQDKMISRGLKFNQLKLISALHETKQISAAAAILHISQPSASRLLAELEKVVDQKLYSRNPRGITLNEAGVVFAKRAKQMLRLLDDTNREVKETGSGVRGRVNIGAVTGPALEMILPFVKKTRLAHPHVELSIAVDTSPKLAESMLNGQMDFYIGRITEEIDPRPFQTKLIGKEPFVLIVRKDHPLTRNIPKTVQDCIGYDWILQQPGSLMRHAVERYFAENGFDMPTQIINTSSVMMTLGIISQSNAVAPVARSVAEFYRNYDDEGFSSRITLLPVAEDLHVSDYSLIRTANVELSPASKLLYEMMQEQIAGYTAS